MTAREPHLTLTLSPLLNTVTLHVTAQQDQHIHYTGHKKPHFAKKMLYHLTSQQIGCIIGIAKEEAKVKRHNYTSSSKKDLIAEYINPLAEDEQADGYSVLQCLKYNEIEKSNLNVGKRNFKKYILIKITVYFML